MSNSDIEQTGTVKGHIPNRANLSGRISNVVSLSGHISIGSAASDFIIKMTIEVNGNNYTVTSCDKTMEQIDAAVASGQNIKAIAFDKFIMPLIQIMENGESYTFGAFIGSFLVMANVAKNPESGTDDWQFYLSPITADIVEYSNDAMPRISTVSEALDKLIPNSHTHTNKSVLDKFSETDGKPTYDGETLGSDFIIKMTVTSDDNGKYTVTSCSTTVEQIDAAVASEKRVVLIATDTDNNLSREIPIVQGFNGSNYYFATFLLGQAILSFVQKVGENQARWQFVVRQIGSEFISYSNDAIPSISTVGEALDNLVPNSHTHTNKSVLDKFAETDGKPTYNGEALVSDFVIKMTVEFKGSELIVTSCDTTVEQIDEAVVAEKRVVLVASVDGTILELPMVQGNKGYSYYFCAILSESVFLSSVYKIENTSDWSFGTIPISRDITAEDVGYPNSFGEGAPENVGQALDVLITGFNATRKDILRLNKSEHTHTNKSVLDKFAESDGKPTYDGKKISGASTAEEVEYTNAILPDASNVKSALDDTIDTQQTQSADLESLRSGVSALLNAYETQGGDIASLKTQAHTHSNKSVLDKFADSNGKLQYNGSDVGLKGDKGDTPVKGTDYWTESDKAEIVADTLAALPTWTGGSY